MLFQRLCAVFLVVGVVAGCTRKPPSPPVTSPSVGVPDPSKASSEIPPKREFPVNANAAPCDDFYHYACSVPVSHFKLRDDRSRHIFSINDSAERILNAKKEFLAGLPQRKGLSARTAQLKDAFVACMDEPARAKEEKALVAEVQAKVAALADRSALVGFLGSQITQPEASFVAIGHTGNLTDPTKYDLVMSPSLMSLPSKEYYSDKAVVADFENLVTAFFKAIGAKNPAAEAARVVAFEKAFAKDYPTRDEVARRRSDEKYYLDRAKLESTYPSLALGELLAKTPKATKVRSLLPESLAFVDQALQNQPLETLKAVYVFNALSDYLIDAYPDFFKKRIAFSHKHLGGPPQLPPRDERCTEMVMSNFEKELDAELIGVLFPDFDKARFEALVNRVRESIIARLEKNNWLSEQGRKGAIAKMKKARMQLASPNSDEEWDFLKVTDYNPKTPIANSKRRGQVSLDKLFEDLARGRDWRRWSMGPLTVNAYYNPSDNKFVMLQGILQYPFFDATMSDPATLGAVGMVVGHELGHGFDDSGSKYDENGVLRQWMPDSDLKEFRARTGILEKQFGAYVSDKINPNYGKLTLGENIADVSGLRFAYDAAFPAGEGSLEAKQAFFLQYGRVWCGVMLPKEMERRLRTDPHAQTEQRVNGPLMHQAGFYEAYGCKPGDKMFLPEAKRMELW